MTLAEIKSNIIAWVRTGIANNVKSSNVRTLLSWMSIRMDVQEVGRLKITKVSGNTSHELQEGDKVTGIIENQHIINAIYLGGNINLLSSYARVNDPGYSSGNPTENEYDDIEALKAGQANQTSGFNQKVIDASGDPNASAGSAIYLYKGSANAALTDYIRLSDSNTALSNFTPNGGYEGTSKDLKDQIDLIGNSPGVTTVTGDGVDNTDPDNPVISFPDADDIDDSSTTKKLVNQALIDKVAALDQAIILKNVLFDASIGTFPANTEAGWAYIVGTSGTVDGINFQVSDRLTSLQDNASTTTFSGNWFHEDYSDVSFKAELEASNTKATPVDADIFGFLNSAASNVLVKFTWANFKTFLDSLFSNVRLSNVAGDLNTTEKDDFKAKVGIIASEPIQVTKTGTTSFTSETLSDGGFSQIGKNILVKNSATAINITVGAIDNFLATYQKEGTGAITFLASTGKTIREVNGTAIMSGALGSTASVSVDGNTISLKVSNA